jgi:hypothetical protein
MERNLNPDEGDADEAQAEAETQLIEGKQIPEASALPKPGAKQVGSRTRNQSFRIVLRAAFVHTGSD